MNGVAMAWIIERVILKSESIFLINTRTTISRQISVPGATDASIQGNLLTVYTNSDYVWKIDLQTGSRKRLITTIDYQAEKKESLRDSLPAFLKKRAQ